MSASRIDPILAQLKSEVGNFEKALLDLIQIKKKKIARSEPLMEINKTNQQLKNSPIAIIGMASLFPEAKNLQEYWDNIMREVDCITEVPPSRWDIDTFYDPDPKAQDKTYCKRGGFIPDIDFNPMEFGLPPNILEFTDVSQLVSLVIAKKAMEDAGYGETREFNREQAGVILGAAVGRPLSGPLTARMQYPIWERVLKSSGLSDEDTQQIVQKIKLAYLDWEENSFPGMLTNVIAGRIANRLDFGGTNCAIDAACASSLSAFKMAVSELSEHRSDLMLTGGIDIDNSIITFLCFSKTPALSKRQESRPFDAESDGMMVGEGVGMLVLKRLEDAERDGDRIYAVIKGIGSSSDGRYKSIYAPRPEGQARALVRAYEAAGFSPETVGLIEAHGTGTAAGDPAEFAALNQVFSQANAKVQSIALGSVKSQIGHTKAAAGAASLIKATLALHHKVLPATINITQPHPKLGLETSPFYLNTKTRPWIRSTEQVPRRAGVSSFGFGGTNFHIVLEEYQGEQQQTYRLHSTVQSLLLTAPTSEQLLERCQTVWQTLQTEAGDREYAALVEQSKTLKIPVEVARLGFVAGSRAEACNLLQLAIEQLRKSKTIEAWNHPQGIYYRKTGIATSGKVVALFSGQGSQYLEMGRELTLNFPELRQGYSEMDSQFVKDGLKPLSEVVFPPPVFDEAQQQAQVAALQRTDSAQPAIGVFSTGLYKLLHRAGFRPDFVAGHSFGELTALWAAGVLSDSDYAVLVKARGQAMAAPNEPDFDAGAMLAVKGDSSHITTVIQQFPQVTIANLNSGQQVVLAGAKAEIAKVQQKLQEQGFSPILLPVAAAFHTPLVGHAQKPFAQAVEAITFSRPTLPVYTNVTGKQYPAEPQAIQKILKEHLINKVFFQQEIEAIYADGGHCFIEFGPKNVLTNLVKEILVNQPHEAIALNANWRKDSDRQLREAAVQLRVIGLPLTHLDPYQLERPVPEISPKAKALNVRLTAANYISDKTKRAFDRALHDGHQVKFATPSLEVSTVEESVAVISKTESNHKADVDLKQVLPVNHSQSLHLSNGQALNGHPQNKQLQNGNHHEYSQNNGSNGHLQNKPLVSVVDAVQSVAQLDRSPAASTKSSSSNHPPTETAPQQAEPVSMQQPSEPKGLPMANLPLNYQRVLESLESSLAEFSHHQRGILQVHEQYLHQHVDYAQTFLNLTQQQNALLCNERGSGDAAAPGHEIVASLERSMMQFHQHHGETLRVHDQSLQRQADYARSFFQVLNQQYAGLVSGEIATEPFQPDQTASNGTQRLQEKVTEFAAAIATAPPLSPSIMPMAQPAESPTVKMPAIADLVPVLPTAAKTAPSSTNGAHAKQDDRVTVKIEMPTVAEPPTVIPAPASAAVAVTAPPVVERPQPEFNEKANAEPEPSKMNRAAEVKIPTPPEPLIEFNVNTQVPDPKAVPEPVTATATGDESALVEALLAIVSAKTGYPADMLELDLDMEADLGIDSIKRVEILGAMQQQFPDYPAMNPEDMGELRTLGQIIEQMRSSVAGLSDQAMATDFAAAAVSIPAIEQIPVVSNGHGHTGVLDIESPPTSQVASDVATSQEKGHPNPSPVLTRDPELSSTSDSEPTAVGDGAALVEALLAIVSAKTGYPADMLELDLDMEADLGIDSIKRVEILGAMQQQFPDYPAMNPEDMGELRTLGQIIQQMQSQTMGAEKKTVQSPALANSLA